MAEDTGAKISDSIEAAVGKNTENLTAGQVDCVKSQVLMTLLTDDPDFNGDGMGESSLKDNETTYSEEQSKQGIVSYPKDCTKDCRCSCEGCESESCLCRITLVEQSKSYLFDGGKGQDIATIEPQLLPYTRYDKTENPTGDYEKYYLHLRKPAQKSKGKLGSSCSASPSTEVKNPCDRSYSIGFKKNKDPNTMLDEGIAKINGYSAPTQACLKDASRNCFRNATGECGKTPCECVKVKELSVGSYGDLDKEGVSGDQITPHHMPSDSYMKLHVHQSHWNSSVNRKTGTPYENYVTADGVTLNMQEARHEQTFTYKGPGDSHAYYKMTPTNALLEDILNVRTIYSKAGQYNASVKSALEQVWDENVKVYFPEMYKRNQAVSPEEYKNLKATSDATNESNRANALATAKAKVADAETRQADLAKDLANCSSDQEKAQLTLEKDAVDAEVNYWKAQETLKSLPADTPADKAEEAFQDMKSSQSSYYYYKGKLS